MRRAPAPELPEHLLVQRLDNTWRDSALAVVSKWIGRVYQLTNVDRHLPFQHGVDPDNPPGLIR